MNRWYMYGLYLLMIIILFITICISSFMLIVFRKKNRTIKKPLLCCMLSTSMLVCLCIFIFSHKIYYKYSDWWIVNNNILNVKERYGEFDIGTYEEERGGTVGYYIYTDNGPIMPDHSKHYYFIQYDEQGVVYRVYETIPLGG